MSLIVAASPDSPKSVLEIPRAPSDTATLGVATASVGSERSARSALDAIDAAMRMVSDHRAVYGAINNRLDSASSNVATESLAMQSARGRIVDVDVAEASSARASNEALASGATSVLAQAVKVTDLLLKLLRG